MNLPFRIVFGTPTDEELAALVVVLLSRAAAYPAPPPHRSHWRPAPYRSPVSWQRHHRSP
jgi:hypothetical protein